MKSTTTATPVFPSIKICYEQQIRRIPLSDDLSFELFENYVRRCFELNDAPLKLSYFDDEDDRVVVSSDIEFQEALRTMLNGKDRYPRFDVSFDFPKHSSVCKDCQLPLVGIFYKCSARSDYELCQQCELKSIQPHPMIKFYPGMASSQVFVTLKAHHICVNTSNPNHEMVHQGVRCDECGIFPIVGIRYKCSGRDDYDLCSNCEERKFQPFPMIKIYTSEQSKCGILVRKTRDQAVLDQSLDLLQFLSHSHLSCDNPCPSMRKRCYEMFQQFCGSTHTDESIFHSTDSSTSSLHNQESHRIDEDILQSVIRESLEASASGSSPQVPDPYARPSDFCSRDEELWSKELGLLRAMGFVNSEALLPLLKEHLGIPIDQGFPNPEKMQNLIFSLLSNV